MYRLKQGQESFTPVEGPFAGRTFAPGKVYDQIPPGEERRFDRIGGAPTPAAAEKKPAKAEIKKTVSGPSSEKNGGK